MRQVNRMLMRNFILFGLWSIVCVGVHVALAKDAAASSPPRYQLKVGQELNYHEDGERRTSSGGKWGDTKDWQLWVVRQNADGSWRIVVGCTGTEWSFDENGKRSDSGSYVPRVVTGISRGFWVMAQWP